MRNMLLSGKFLLLLSLLLMSAICFAQVTEKWVQRQNGEPNADDVPNDLAVDQKGNVYVTGRSDGKGTNADFTTVKYNDDGDLKWERRYNGPGNSLDAAVAITVDDKCNVYVTGWSTGSGTGRDFVTVKYNDDGDKKWVKRYNGPGNGTDEATAIAVDRKGNVYVTGWSTGSGTNRDYTTIKYDDDGDVEWIRRYNGPGNGVDQATAIGLDDDCNVYVTGWSTGSGTDNDYTTIKYDDDGNEEWVQRYNGPVNDRDRASALAVDASSNVYVTGFISVVIDEDGNPADIATIKYNTAGVQQWAAIYNGESFDQARAIAVDSSGNVFVTGEGGAPDETFFWEFVTIKYNAAGLQQWAITGSSPQVNGEVEINDLALDKAGNVYITGLMMVNNARNYITIKYNTNGIQQWMAFYNGAEVATPFATTAAIGVDKNGNVYITGSSRFRSDFITLKYNANGVQQWVQRYNGPGGGGPDMPTAIAVDDDGNVHVTGGMTKIRFGIDYTTYKYDKFGDRIWKKTFTGPGPRTIFNIDVDQAEDLVLDRKGNVYITGASAASNGFGDYTTIKYDEDGNTQWVRRYNGPANSHDGAMAIAVDEKGNVYVTGESIGVGTNSDYATIKYDCDGNMLWVARYNNPNNRNDIAVDIAVDKLGNVYVTGASDSTGSNSDYITIKYDANGNELWVARFNGPGNSIDAAHALALDALGNVYVTGFSFAFGSNDYTTIKYNTAGLQQWVALYNGPGNGEDIANDLAVDSLGNVYVTGQSAGSGTGADYATIKYNTAGVQQWAARYNGPANDIDAANALTLDTAGNVYVTGQSEGIGTSADYATVKYDATGVQQWVIRYNGPGNDRDIATAIAVDDNANVYITGRSVGNGTDFDYATIKYKQTTVVARSSTGPEPQTPVVAERGAVTLHAKAFPNSFTEFVNLQWHGSGQPVTITITDAMGRLIEKRTGLGSSGTLQTGHHFRPGLYYAEIVQGKEKFMIKLIRR
ncbi:SBBP repeat-containing protein [Longitalea luteola]|uniref:SBBP repeat-containing protein n=1 Tax=Longitalea luteola TaxID=2812563 RepID=UPI001A96AD2E|nr:SBBP repeat-containing protein [Longitalea luteola]